MQKPAAAAATMLKTFLVPAPSNSLPSKYFMTLPVNIYLLERFKQTIPGLKMSDVATPAQL